VTEALVFGISQGTLCRSCTCDTTASSSTTAVPLGSLGATLIPAAFGLAGVQERLEAGAEVVVHDRAMLAAELVLGRVGVVNIRRPSKTGIMLEAMTDGRKTDG
jgi:hypothetical protein